MNLGICFQLLIRTSWTGNIYKSMQQQFVVEESLCRMYSASSTALCVRCAAQALISGTSSTVTSANTELSSRVSLSLTVWSPTCLARLRDDDMMLPCWRIVDCSQSWTLSQDGHLMVTPSLCMETQPIRCDLNSCALLEELLNP